MISDYLAKVSKRYASGISREHSYRGDLEELVRSLTTGVEVTNEPTNVTDCGNPDYVLTKGKIPIGYIEAKDVGKDLASKNYKEQFDRYRNALDNLIITDYLWFRFYQNNELVHEVRIAEIVDGKVEPIPANFEYFADLLKDFCQFIGQTIKSPAKLAKMMAGKAKLLKSILEEALNADEQTMENSSLQGQFQAFKSILIHDLTIRDFADIYSQTLAYGMFAARLHDETLDDFSRYEAAELIPKSNPFLRRLFGYIAGPDIDERIKTTVDNLADVFRATNIKELLKNFGKRTKMQDPIIHFYETFLGEYDPKLKKARGVWYTPEPVVKFIVRSVDKILRRDFGLASGLADTSKTKIKVDTQTPDNRSKTGYKQIEKEVHKVQILDPATGTGTFLAEVVSFIYEKKFKAMQGAWSAYVDEHLIPRLNGFELLMASYSMAHLKLDMLLRETGYQSGETQRLNIYLTNSLEEEHSDTGTIFSAWLSTEANEANHIKRDTPVMCVIGNPPYSGESANKGDWIMKIMEDYKKEPGAKVKLQERNSKWINDDYVKFIRFGQHYIDKNGEGVLAFINPHGYLDNPTFRGMRWNLLQCFDEIYTLDLHGNAKKKEVCPDGSKDENVFDIQQGVSINILVKTGKSEGLGKVKHFDLYGRRDDKYDFLYEQDVESVAWQELTCKEPNYFFVPKDTDLQEEYEKGFSVADLFPVNNVGIVTSRDNFVIDEDKELLEKRINDFFLLDKEELVAKYKLKENKSWKIDEVKSKANSFDSINVKKVSYRPFDDRHLYYDNNFIERSRMDVMQHFLKGDNLGLVAARQCVSDWRYIFVTHHIGEFNLTGTAGRFGSGGFFPLYLYEDDDQIKIGDK